MADFLAALSAVSLRGMLEWDGIQIKVISRDGWVERVCRMTSEIECAELRRLWIVERESEKIQILVFVRDWVADLTARRMVYNSADRMKNEVRRVIEESGCTTEHLVNVENLEPSVYRLSLIHISEPTRPY